MLLQGLDPELFNFRHLLGIQFAIDATQLLLARSRSRTADKFLPQHEIGEVRQRLAETVRVMIGFFLGVVLGAPAFQLFGFICLAPVIGIVFCLAIAASRHGLTTD